MNILRYSFALFLLGVWLLPACNKEEAPSPDPCSDPCANIAECANLCPDAGPGAHKNDFVPQGDVTETPDGYMIDGTLAYQPDGQEQEVVFTNAHLELSFNEDGSLRSISGSVQIPSPDPCIDFADPVQGDIGYFQGEYINKNFDLGFTLPGDKGYFIFYIGVTFEMNVCTNDNPDATKPVTVSLPLGGQILYVADYADPFIFIKAGQDLIGSICFGGSKIGQMGFVPLEPVEGIKSFGANSVRCGSFSVFKVINVNGLSAQSASLRASFLEEDPFEIEYEAGYQAGINGDFTLSLPIVKFVSFDLPLGAASAGIQAVAGPGGIEGKAFVNGIASPDNSWLPDFVPVRPGAEMRATGFVQQEGQFEIGISGELSLELPERRQAVEGELRANNQDFTMQGSITKDDGTWGASAAFRKSETELFVEIPESLLSGMEDRILADLRDGIQEYRKARDEWQQALEDYEFEVSLRGLKEAIPQITSNAKAAIDKGVRDGKAAAKREVENALGSQCLCNDALGAIYGWIDDIARPYYRALDRLNTAVNLEDSQAAREELENALRNLVNLQEVNTSKSFKICVGQEILGSCVKATDRSRTVSLSFRVISLDQVAQLEQAAENIQYIPQAYDRQVSLKAYLDSLPSDEALQKLIDEIESGLKMIPGLDQIGYIKDHQSGTFTFFMVENGQREEVDPFDLFDIESIDKMVADYLR